VRLGEPHSVETNHSVSIGGERWIPQDLAQRLVVRRYSEVRGVWRLQKYSVSQRPGVAETPDTKADVMAEFLNVNDGQTRQSIPVVVFYTKDVEYLTVRWDAPSGIPQESRGVTDVSQT